MAMDEAKDERYLRDTLTILHERLPKRRRVDESIDDSAVATGEDGSSDNVGRELIQEQRKACLRELIPIILGGPFAFNKSNSSSDNDSFENNPQKDEDTAATAADAPSSSSALAPPAPSSEVDENKSKILDEAKVDNSNKMDLDEPTAKYIKDIEKDEEKKDSSTEDDKIISNVEKDDAKLVVQEVKSTATSPVASRLDYYKKDLEFLKAQNDEFAKERLEKFRKYAHLLAGYEYGLKHVSKLTDLSNAPDNILDGNFPKNQSSMSSASTATTIAARPGATMTSAKTSNATGNKKISNANTGASKTCTIANKQ